MRGLVTRVHILFACALLAVLPLLAFQAPQQPGLSAKLLESSAEDGQAYALLEDLLAEAPKRLSGSDGYEDAVAWAEQAMRAAGLQNVRREPVRVPRWERGAPEVAYATLRDGSRLELAVTALGNCPATGGPLTAEVVEVDGLEGLSRNQDRLAGKIVFLNEAMDPESDSSFKEYVRVGRQRWDGPALSAKVGAAAVVIRSLSTLRDDAPHTGNTGFRGEEPIPALALGVLSAEKLSAALAAGRVESLTLETHCRGREERLSANVVGEIPGDELADEIVVVGGHLDAWDTGNGAHDDAAGCIHSIEAARLLVAAGARPKRTIRVVFFANEENGLRGGEAYAEAHEDEEHFFAYESDRGGFRPRGVSFSLGPDVLERLRPLGAPLSAVDAAALFPGGGGADISPLKRRGVPVGSLTPLDRHYFDVHHSANDVLESVDPEELQLGALVTAHWLAVLADLEPGALEAE